MAKKVDGKPTKKVEVIEERGTVTKKFLWTIVIVVDVFVFVMAGKLVAFLLNQSSDVSVLGGLLLLVVALFVQVLLGKRLFRNFK